mgnify:CR=1 FL=1
MKNYYCSQKFYQLKIDAEKKTINSCCKADGENINTTWLQKNPGQIFNTPKLIQERKDMLKNIRIAGCENPCWKTEDNGLWSRRLKHNTHKKTITKLSNKPSHLDITLGSECNLACSYCCKDFSSSWRREIEQNGPLENLDDYKNRFTLSSFDKALKKLSQKKKNSLKIFTLIEKEIDIMKDNLTSITITGGEPFLHYRFPELIDKFKNVKYLTVYSGLGVSTAVLKRGLDALSKNQNVDLCISAESIGKNFEFNRYGSKWRTFLQHIEIIESYGINIIFNMSYGNLNVGDFVNFNNYFYKYKKKLNMIDSPVFMSAYNLDDESKDNVIRTITDSEYSDSQDAKLLVQTLRHQTNEKLRMQISTFVKQMCKRRDINIDFMPSSFRKWIDL